MNDTIHLDQLDNRVLARCFPSKREERKVLVAGDSYLILPRQSENWGQDST